VATDSGADRADAFDLNIGKVLEHWTVPFAIREVIANALDEAALSGTAEPQIARDEHGIWHIRDFGRGLRYAHLTQNESAEKRRHPAVIGQFGMGLKDALATFDRRGIGVTLRSRHGDIATGRHGKAGKFSDVITLHALVRPPADPQMIGTDVELAGVTDAQIAEAKKLFLRYSAEVVLEETRFGQVLQRPANRGVGRVYVKGLLVAEEPNFLFSYNVTDLNAPLRRALPNRLHRSGEEDSDRVHHRRGGAATRRGSSRLHQRPPTRRARVDRRGPTRMPRTAEPRQGSVRDLVAASGRQRTTAVCTRRRLQARDGTR
jgi:hypothetical protein